MLITKKYVGELIGSSRDGKRTIWCDNGERKIEGMYVKGVKNGFQHEWNEDGAMLSETVYKSGKIIQLKNCAYDICDSTITYEKIIKIKKLKTKQTCSLQLFIFLPIYYKDKKDR